MSHFNKLLNLVSVIVIIALGFSWKLIRVWVPLNLIFVGMLVTGMDSLKYMNIALVTILKNVTNIITAVGKYYIFRKCQSRKVWIAMLLMIISAMSGGITDLSFDAVDYTWQIVNCFLTAGYSIPISIAGIVLFNVPLGVPNFFSILFGLFAQNVLNIVSQGSSPWNPSKKNPLIFFEGRQ